MNINLHIDRFVLHGVSIDTHQCGVLQQTLLMELTRLLSTHGVANALQSDLAVRSIQAQSIDLVSGSNSQQLGSQIANSVYKGINR